MGSVTEQHPSQRLKRLLGFLNGDPSNRALIGDAAEAAFDEQLFDLAAQLLEQYRALEPLPPTLANLSGLVALARQDYAAAAEVFERLRMQSPADAALKFNLAWSYAMMQEWQKALDQLDDDAVAASKRAPSLKVHVMHHLGQYDEALAAGAQLAERFPEDGALMGSLATLAMDADRADLARQYAQRGASSPEGATALGYVSLGDHDAPRSLELFDRAIAEQPDNARAWVGKGLGLLAEGKAEAGSQAIDHGAELFKDHLGSWIASGWAHFARGDYAQARRSFERAEALDANFSECHGGLAVIDLIDGRKAEAQRRCEIALRLDRKSFGGALAKVLLLSDAGRPELARKVRDMAFSTPVGQHGETLGQLLAMVSSKPGR
ncbi:MAG: tetratricopeptide repeat protein [Alphaproteobacteria bacterium]|nr:tetratricopeptide repeat protein [Alphaproteobacteria bacterium]